MRTLLKSIFLLLSAGVFTMVGKAALVAEWTDFSSADKDGVITTNEGYKLYLQGNTGSKACITINSEEQKGILVSKDNLSLEEWTIVLDVEQIPTKSVVVDAEINGNYIGIVSDTHNETVKYIHSWTDDPTWGTSKSGAWEWNPAHRRVITLTYKYNNGTTSYINGATPHTTSGLKANDCNLNEFTIGYSPNKSGYSFADGMKIYSVKLYDTRLDDAGVVNDFDTYGTSRLTSATEYTATVADTANVTDLTWTSDATLDDLVVNKAKLTVSDNATLVMNESASTIGLTVEGTGPLTITNTDSNKLTAYTTTINADTTIEAGAASLGVVTVANSKMLTVNDQALTQVSIASNAKLVTNGDVSLTGANTIAQNGVLSVASGTTRLNATADGNIAIAKGATLVNLKASDALNYHGTTTVDVYGTLDMGSTRWTMGANNTLNLYEGAVVQGDGEGTGQNSAGALDWYQAGNVNVRALDDDDSDIVTIAAKLRTKKSRDNNGNIKFNIDNGVKAIVTGQIIGDKDVTVKSGVLELTNQNTYSGTTTIDSGATLLFAPSAKTGKIFADKHNVVVNGTLNIKQGLCYAKLTGAGAINVLGEATIGIAEGDIAGSGIKDFSGTVTIGADAVADFANWSNRADDTLNGCNITVNGTLTTSGDNAFSLQIASGKTLSGTGTISVPLTLADGATIDASAGAVTVTGAVELPSTLTVKLSAEQACAQEEITILTANVADVTLPTTVEVKVGDVEVGGMVLEKTQENNALVLKNSDVVRVSVSETSFSLSQVLEALGEDQHPENAKLVLDFGDTTSTFSFDTSASPASIIIVGSKAVTIQKTGDNVDVTTSLVTINANVKASNGALPNAPIQIVKGYTLSLEAGQHATYASEITVNSGATLQFNYGAGLTDTNSSIILEDGAKIVAQNGAGSCSTIASAITVNGTATIQGSENGEGTTFSGNISGTGTLMLERLNYDNAMKFTGIISSNLKVVITHTGKGVIFSRANTYTGGTEITKDATLVVEQILNLGTEGKVIVDGRLRFQNTGTVNLDNGRGTAYGTAEAPRLVGSGVLEFYTTNDDHWYVLPADFTTPLAFVNNCKGGIVVADSPGITIGTLFGDGYFRTDWGEKQADSQRYITVKQAELSTFSGYFKGHSAQKRHIILKVLNNGQKNEDVTLKLTNNDIAQDNTTLISESMIQIDGAWKKAATINGTGVLSGTGSITGTLTLADGATIDATKGAVDAKGTVTWNGTPTIKVNGVEETKVLGTTKSLPNACVIKKDDTALTTVLLVAKEEGGIYSVEPVIANSNDMDPATLVALKEVAAANGTANVSSITGNPDAVIVFSDVTTQISDGVMDIASPAFGVQTIGIHSVKVGEVEKTDANGNTITDVNGDPVMENDYDHHVKVTAKINGAALADGATVKLYLDVNGSAMPISTSNPEIDNTRQTITLTTTQTLDALLAWLEDENVASVEEGGSEEGEQSGESGSATPPPPTSKTLQFTIKAVKTPPQAQ